MLLLLFLLVFLDFFLEIGGGLGHLLALLIKFLLELLVDLSEIFQFDALLHAQLGVALAGLVAQELDHVGHGIVWLLLHEVLDHLGQKRLQLLGHLRVGNQRLRTFSGHHALSALRILHHSYSILVYYLLFIN